MKKILMLFLLILLIAGQVFAVDKRDCRPYQTPMPQWYSPKNIVREYVRGNLIEETFEYIKYEYVYSGGRNIFTYYFLNNRLTSIATTLDGKGDGFYYYTGEIRENLNDEHGQFKRTVTGKVWVESFSDGTVLTAKYKDKRPSHINLQNFIIYRSPERIRADNRKGETAVLELVLKLHEEFTGELLTLAELE